MKIKAKNHRKIPVTTARSFVSELLSERIPPISNKKNVPGAHSRSGSPGLLISPSGRPSSSSERRAKQAIEQLVLATVPNTGDVSAMTMGGRASSPTVVEEGTREMLPVSGRCVLEARSSEFPQLDSKTTNRLDRIRLTVQKDLDRIGKVLKRVKRTDPLAHGIGSWGGPIARTVKSPGPHNGIHYEAKGIKGPQLQMTPAQMSEIMKEHGEVFLCEWDHNFTVAMRLSEKIERKDEQYDVLFKEEIAKFRSWDLAHALRRTMYENSGFTEGYEMIIDEENVPVLTAKEEGKAAQSAELLDYAERLKALNGAEKNVMHEDVEDEYADDFADTLDGTIADAAKAEVTATVDPVPVPTSDMHLLEETKTVWLLRCGALHATVKDLSYKDLTDVACMHHPPEFAVNLIAFVGCLLGLEPTWKAARRTMFHELASLIHFLSTIDPLCIPMSRIRQALDIKERTMPGLSAASCHGVYGTRCFTMLTLWVLEFTRLGYMLLAVKESIKLNREKDLLLAYTESLTTSQDVSQVTLPALSLSTVSTDTNGVDFVKEKKPKKKKKKNGPDSADSSPPVRRKPKPKPLGITGTNSKAFIFDHLSLNPHFFTDKLPLPKFSSFDDHGSLNSSVAFEIGDGAFQNINGNDNEDKIAGMGVLAMDEVHMQQMINDRDRLNSDNGAQDNRGRPKEIEAHGEDHSFAPSSANSASSARSGSTAHSNISNLQPPKNYSIASIMKRSEDKDGNSANTRVTNTAEGDNNDFYDDYQDGFEEEDKREEKKGEQEFKVRDNREPDFRPHIDHASKASAYGHNEEAHVLGGRENSPSNTLIMNAYAFEESDHQADPHKYNSHKGVKLADDYNLVIDEEKKWKPDPHKYDKNHKLHQHHPHHHESPHKSRSPHSPHTSQPTTPVLVGGEKNSDEADLATPVLTSLQLSAPVPQSATDVKQEEEPYEYGYQLEAGVNGDHFTDALPINHHDQASASPAESTEKEVEGKVLALELGEEEEKYTDEDFDAESPSKPDAPVSVPVVEPETEAETIVVSASGSQSGSRPTTPYREFATKYVTRALTPELTSRPATPKETDTFKVEVEKVDEGNDEETVATAETVDQGAASAILPAEIEAEIKMETDENTVEKAGIVLDAKVKEDLDEQIDVEATGAPAVGAQAVTEIGTEKDKGAEKEEVETDEGLPSYDEAIAEEGTAAAAPLQEHNIQNQHTIIEGGAATVDPISGNADKNADANVRVGADVGADVGPSALEVKAEETVPDAATAMDANANADAGVDENTGTVMTEASETDSIVVPVLAAASEKAKIDEPEAVTLTAESI